MITSSKKTVTPIALVDSHIRTIRGQKIILDSDLATLYQVQTFRLNEAVRRNRERFPEDFMFQLTHQEVASLKSQIAMSSSRHGGRRTMPYAFTEHGIAMLSSVLNSARAIQVNIMIVRAFIRLREMVSQSKDIAARVEKMEHKQERVASVIEVLVEDIDKLTDEVKRMKRIPSAAKRKIGFAIGVDELKKR
ncbi:MAG: ORF6N domain-containing protein [Alphaproteobacteria bacterium]|nr:ORF6N domain-containing protein [Alphaproteobacteria bacterium]